VSGSEVSVQKEFLDRNHGCGNARQGRKTLLAVALTSYLKLSLELLNVQVADGNVTAAT
jgi:hypothetical protein